MPGCVLKFSENHVPSTAQSSIIHPAWTLTIQRVSMLGPQSHLPVCVALPGWLAALTVLQSIWLYAWSMAADVGAVNRPVRACTRYDRP